MSADINAVDHFSCCNYCSLGGIEIQRKVEDISINGAVDKILQDIDYRKGALFSSSYEYPGRYTQWDIGFVDPCLELRAAGRDFSIKALNANGARLLPPILTKLQELAEINSMQIVQSGINGNIMLPAGFFPEEQRSRQPTIFTVIRAIKDILAWPDDRFLGLYGAFGYDLVFQFEPIKLQLQRDPWQDDLVLYLPDDFVVVDHRMARAYHFNYSFAGNGQDGREFIFAAPAPQTGAAGEENAPLPAYQEGRYAGIVKEALDYFRRGDLFEVVPSQTLYNKCELAPSGLFNRLRAINPSPYGFVINLGHDFLVGASPEMYVRVEGKRVETCPISGTIKRGRDAVEDASQIRTLLNSYKDEAELTMCTDVDRNDKSRICEPGSVKVIGRRQIELYSHLIHTVDHVEGVLREEFDSLDAFLSHMWAVTVTGAPKRAAIQWLENHEDSPRGWYGGAVGFLSFNGDLNTGLTLRTIHIKNGIARVRVGATLLYDSVPEHEEEETLVKAAALLKSLNPRNQADKGVESINRQSGKGKKVLLVDHEDSFVHTLANYIRQTGASVEVLRAPFAREILREGSNYDLVVLSPGPGSPSEFALNATIDLALSRGLPLFGVCLGLQGIVEYFGGELGQLDYPWHGKSSLVNVCNDNPVWRYLPQQFAVGRYHSLFAQKLPDCLRSTAVSEDKVVMAVEHCELPVAAVQFHPESIMTARNDIGMQLVDNVLSYLIRE